MRLALGRVHGTGTPSFFLFHSQRFLEFPFRAKSTRHFIFLLFFSFFLA